MDTPRPLLNEDQVPRLPTHLWWRVSKPQDLTYRNYLTVQNREDKPIKTRLIQDYIVHRVCMNNLPMDYTRPACCFGRRVIRVVVPGEDIFKGKYDLLGQCDCISSAIQDLVIFDDVCYDAGFKTDIVSIPYGYTDAVYSYVPHRYVYHTYLVVKQNKTISLIFDGSVSNYRTDKNVFLGTPDELVWDLKDLLKNRTNSYRLFYMPIRPREMLPKYLSIFRYCIGDRSVPLEQAAHDLFDVWYGRNMYPVQVCTTSSINQPYSIA